MKLEDKPDPKQANLNVLYTGSKAALKTQIMSAYLSPGKYCKHPNLEYIKGIHCLHVFY